MVQLLIILMVFVSVILCLYIQIAILRLNKRCAYNIPLGYRIEDLERLVDEGHCKSEAIAGVVREVINIGPWPSALDPSFISILHTRLDAMDAGKDGENNE